MTWVWLHMSRSSLCWAPFHRFQNISPRPSSDWSAQGLIYIWMPGFHSSSSNDDFYIQCTLSGFLLSLHLGSSLPCERWFFVCAPFPLGGNNLSWNKTWNVFLLCHFSRKTLHCIDVSPAAKVDKGLKLKWTAVCDVFIQPWKGVDTFDQVSSLSRLISVRQLVIVTRGPIDFQ